MPLTKKDLFPENTDTFVISSDLIVACTIKEVIKFSYLDEPSSIDYESLRYDILDVCVQHFEKINDRFYCLVFDDYDSLCLWIEEHILTINRLTWLYSPTEGCKKKSTLNFLAQNICQDLIRELIPIDFSNFSAKEQVKIFFDSIATDRLTIEHITEETVTNILKIFATIDLSNISAISKLHDAISTISYTTKMCKTFVKPEGADDKNNVSE